MNVSRKLFFLLASIFLTFINSAQADSEKLFNSTTKHTYQRFDTPKTWQDANDACTAEKGYLATITSQLENNWLRDNSLINIYSSYSWVGGQVNAAAYGDISKMQWQWITGENWTYNPLPLGFAGTPGPFGTTIGTTGYGSGDFKLAIVRNGTWYTFSSSLGPYSYICEWNKAFKTYTNMITGDTNNDGIDEFILLGNDRAIIKVLSYDFNSEALISNVSFLSSADYKGVSLTLIDDMNGNGTKEFTLLMTKIIDGTSIIQIRDSKSGVQLKSYTPPR